MSIFFVMNYAKKVKADKGSTILSMQELKDAEEAHGKAASEVHKVARRAFWSPSRSPSSS